MSRTVYPWMKVGYYRQPLLVILAKLTKFKANFPVPVEEVNKYLLTYCGIRIDRLPPGFEDLKDEIKKGRNVGPFLKARHVVYKAENNGHTIYSPGRGLYALTDKGVEEAKKMKRREIRWEYRKKTPGRILGKDYKVVSRGRIPPYTPTESVKVKVSNLPPREGKKPRKLRKARVVNDVIDITPERGTPIAVDNNPRETRKMMAGAVHSDVFQRTLEDATYEVMAEMLPLMQQRIMQAVMESMKAYSQGRQARNMTRDFLEKQSHEFYQKVLSCLRSSSSLRGSVTASLEEEHLQEFFMQAIATDKLRNYLLRNGEPTPSMVAGWAKKIGFSQIQAWGQDAALRASRGALTEREVKSRKEESDAHRRVAHSGDIVVSKDESGASQIQDFVADGTPESEYERQRTTEALLQQAEMILRKNAPKAADRYIAVFKHVAEGLSDQEIAKALGIPVSRAADRRKKAWHILKRARANGEISIFN